MKYEFSGSAAMTAAIGLLMSSLSFAFATPARAFHPCPPFHRAEHRGRFSVPVCIPEPPAGNIPTNPRELSEEAWGQAGQAAYRQGSELMLARASKRGSTPRPLDEYQKRYLRPHFGNLVDNVVVFYNVPPLDNWQILGMGIKSHTDAQTFCERIFVNGQYNSTDRNQLALLAHELVHSQQCQRFGGVERFGYEYFKAYKKANLNYDNISLEQEAYAFEASFKKWLSDSSNGIASPSVSSVGQSQIVGLANKCIGVRNGNSESGTPLILWECNGNADQKWSLTSQASLQGLAGKCIGVQNGNSESGTPLILWECNGNADQRWSLTSQGSLQGLAGKCIGVQNGNSESGTPLILWECNGNADQRWRISP